MPLGAISTFGVVLMLVGIFCFGVAGLALGMLGMPNQYAVSTKSLRLGALAGLLLGASFLFAASFTD